MLDLAGKTLLERVYQSVSRSKKINNIVVATSDQKTDDIIKQKLQELNLDCYRGDLDNVLKRFYDTASKYDAKNIIRITADNPLMDGTLIDKLVELYEAKEVDYSMFLNAIYGLSAEVFSFDALKLAYENSRNNFDKEHVTPYIKNNCKVYFEDVEEKYRLPSLSVTIDTLDDYVKLQKFYLYCNRNNLEPIIDEFIIRAKNNEKQI